MTKMQVVSTLIKPTLHICHTHIVPKPPSQFCPLADNKLKILPTIFTPRPTSPKPPLYFYPNTTPLQKTHLYFYPNLTPRPKTHLYFYPNTTPLQKTHCHFYPNLTPHQNRPPKKFTKF